MKNLLISLIIGSAIGGIWVQYRITGSIWNNKTTKDAFEEGYNEGYKNAEINMKTWKCRVVKWCPWSDWRYTKAEDVCEFDFIVVRSIENPKIKGVSGEFCNELK